MPREIGTVVRVDDGIATVHFDRRAACEKCGACGMLKNRSVMEITLPVGPDIRPGDRVALRMEDSFFYLSALLLYGVPLLALVAGVAGGAALSPLIRAGWDPQLAGAMAGLALAAASYAMLRLFNRRFMRMRVRRMTVERVNGENSE
jgi:sigma-E factor negative regulatory protein RseC